MGKNEYLKQRAERDKACYDAGMKTGMQIVHDFVTMTLRDQEVMGKDTFGRARIEKLFDNVRKLDNHFCLAFTTHKEADAKQEEMDAVLKELYGDELVKFQERYPYIKQYGYDKARKGWVE